MCLAIFTGCVKYETIHLPNFSEEKFLVEINGKKNILYIAHRENRYNFSLFDSFGIPLSSKVLENGKFKSTKFLPPNALYEFVFVESLEMLKANENKREFKKNFKQIRIVRL